MGFARIHFSLIILRHSYQPHCPVAKKACLVDLPVLQDDLEFEIKKTYVQFRDASTHFIVKLEGSPSFHDTFAAQGSGKSDDRLARVSFATFLMIV